MRKKSSSEMCDIEKSEKVPGKTTGRVSLRRKRSKLVGTLQLFL
jgi:hypothetical protein